MAYTTVVSKLKATIAAQAAEIRELRKALEKLLHAADKSAKTWGERIDVNDARARLAK
jgi:hypothetical protein